MQIILDKFEDKEKFDLLIDGFKIALTPHHVWDNIPLGKYVVTTGDDMPSDG